MPFVKLLERIPYATLFALLALISFFTLDSDFLSIDDSVLIVNNPQLTFAPKNIIAFFTSPLGKIFDDAHYQIMFIYYRPALNLLYTLNNTIWGINPVGFHISNLLLHLMTTIFIYRIGLLLLAENRLLSLLAAAIFCVHPAHNELIGRVAMNENLLGFFMSATLYLYFLGRKKLALGLFALALLTKESAIMLPFVLLCFELPKKQIKETLKYLQPYAVIILVYLVIRTAVVGISDHQVASSGSLLQTLSALTAYLRLFFVPYPLTVFYPSWKFVSPLQPDLVMAFAIFLLLGVTLWRLRRDALLISLLLGALILLVPVALKANEMILGLDRAFIAERQLYVPSILFVLFVAALIDRAKRVNKDKCVIVGFLFVLPFFAFLLISANAVWSNNDILNATFVKNYPDGAIARKVKGVNLLNKGDADGALAEFKAALPAVNNSSFATRKPVPGKPTVRTFKDISEFHAVAAYQPAYADLHYYMGCAFLMKNDSDHAIRKFKATLQLDPHLIGARTALAEVYMKNKMYKEASKEFKLALKDIDKFRAESTTYKLHKQLL